MKFIYNQDFKEFTRFLKSYIIHRTKLLWYRLRTGKPWPLYDCYYDKMEEDLDNVPELDPFFVCPVGRGNPKAPVDINVRDLWMPYLYTDAPFFILFRNDYSMPGHYEDYLPLSIGRHPKILVKDYELHISQEDFDWVVKFVRDNRKNLWIFGHFNDDKAYDCLEDYIEQNPAPYSNAGHFKAFKSCRQLFLKRFNESIRDCNLFYALYYCYLHIICCYADNYLYSEHLSQFDLAVKVYEKETDLETLRVLHDVVKYFSSIGKEIAEKFLESYGWSLEDIIGKYFEITIEADRVIGGAQTEAYPSPIWNNMVELIRAKQRWYDYAGFAYLWAVWIFSLNVRNFIYNTFELFWEEYEKLDKSRLLNELKRFHEILGTKTADGHHIYDKLSHIYNYEDNGYGREICAPNIWDEGSDILKNAIQYIEPFFQLKKDITKTVSKNQQQTD